MIETAVELTMQCMFIAKLIFRKVELKIPNMHRSKTCSRLEHGWNRAEFLESSKVSESNSLTVAFRHH